MDQQPNGLHTELTPGWLVFTEILSLKIRDRLLKVLNFANQNVSTQALGPGFLSG